MTATTIHYQGFSSLQQLALEDKDRDERNKSQFVDVILDELITASMGDNISAGSHSELASMVSHTDIVIPPTSVLGESILDGALVPAEQEAPSKFATFGAVDDDKAERSFVQDEKLVLANAFSSGVNLLKTFIGAGIISLPLALASFGLLTGIILLVIAGFTALLGLYFYIYAAVQVGGRNVTPQSFASISWPFLGYLLSISIFFKNIGVGLAYLLLIGNIMSTLMQGFLGGSGFWTNPRIWISTFMVAIIGPLSFLRRLDHLKYSSSLGLVSVAYLLGLSIFHFFAIGISPSSAAVIRLFAPFSMKALSRFGIFVFAFTCHQNILPIYNETRRNSIKELMYLCAVCVAISLAIYVSYGTFSYLCYADVLINGSMFSYYPQDEIPFQIARVLFTLLLAFSYPLQVVPFRMASNFLFRGGKKETILSHVLFTSFILGFTFSISMFLPDLSNVLSLVGSMTSSVICYIVPSLFYLSITSGRPFWAAKRHWACLLLLFGMLVFLCCTSMSIMNFITN
ncbi:hypothetical protein MDAP_001263 [Mitosporidium daphniae]|uniref:Amino acid transporter transmembrane domain-containing protein n=1 Tax=Mitosporidium daphniae TaxID=1485682 RepID=A0A098VPZ4_9MICR|nr:uncharacterized protein DI09_44p20 [Mitosporidium daphniae]KGG51098.1 hypothetical protein DI09_44p20 [Mitosporidium daphniae]|eukprot:XP_013237547.1 uncharacterized protein DI09_44p20 [Mitosporidium daphniae]